MTLELGRWGEQRALKELVNKGHVILQTNYKNRKGELDIVSYDGDTLVVTEVKTRVSRYLSDPASTVGIRKQKTIIHVTNSFMNEFNINNEVRFDIVTIVKNSVMCKIDHIEGAFYPH